MNNLPAQCPNCQFEIKSGVRRCPYCGLALFPNADKDFITRSARCDTALGLSFGLLCLFATAICIGWMSQRDWIDRYLAIYPILIALILILIPIIAYLMLRPSRPALSKGLYLALILSMIVAACAIALLLGLLFICFIITR